MNNPMKAAACVLIASFALPGLASAQGRPPGADDGVDAALLEDRDHGLDAGVGVSWSGAFGRLRLEAVADVTDAAADRKLDWITCTPSAPGPGRSCPAWA